MSDKAMSLLDRILAFMDKPWKAVVIVVLVIVGGGGYLLYLSRAEIAQAVLKDKVKPRLDIEAFHDKAVRLLRETGADLAILSELRIGDNIVISRAGYDSTGKELTLISGPRQAVGETLKPIILIRFLENDVSCFPMADAFVNAQFGAAEQQGIHYGCIVQVPPVLGITVGGLFLGWKTDPDPKLLRNAQYSMRDYAMKFAYW